LNINKTRGFHCHSEIFRFGCLWRLLRLRAGQASEDAVRPFFPAPCARFPLLCHTLACAVVHRRLDRAPPAQDVSVDGGRRPLGVGLRASKWKSCIATRSRQRGASPCTGGKRMLMHGPMGVLAALIRMFRHPALARWAAKGRRAARRRGRTWCCGRTRWRCAETRGPQIRLPHGTACSCGCRNDGVGAAR
ncbi:hypothetical protein B0H11DRAFT_1035497, partial [Mycena galericulata]